MLKCAAAFCLLTLLAMPAAAKVRNTGDMITDQGYAVSDRPAVPSDSLRHDDVFPPVPVFVNPKADMFGRVQPHYDFGREDMLVPHPTRPPAYPLFQDPPK